MRWDVVVVGAGAAGLLAAMRAAERGKRTLLLEKNRKPGVKILMSGGTRCNITHATDARGIIEAFGRQGPFLRSALAALGPSDIVSLLQGEGLATKVEPTGKIFPRSDKASDVLSALLRRLDRSGCQLALGEPLISLERDGMGFVLATWGRSLQADKVIVTTGGKSYPGCGTTGDGYAWAQALGHTLVDPRPALTPVTTGSPWVGQLQGVTIADVWLRVIDASLPRDESRPSGSRPPAACLAEERGSFLFTHFGLSGPAVLNASGAITRSRRPSDLVLQCDFLPQYRHESLDQGLREQTGAEGRKQVATLLARHVPRRLAAVIVQLAQLPADTRGAELSREARQRIVNIVKQLTIQVSGTRGFKKAEVTAGGVPLDQVDPQTMQSKRAENLYFAGEILDLDGPIGGYNFQAAFSTGWLAGSSV